MIWMIDAVSSTIPTGMWIACHNPSNRRVITIDASCLRRLRSRLNNSFSCFACARASRSILLLSLHHFNLAFHSSNARPNTSLFPLLTESADRRFDNFRYDSGCELSQFSSSPSIIRICRSNSFASISMMNRMNR